jgi:hypothetical protein
MGHRSTRSAGHLPAETPAVREISGLIFLPINDNAFNPGDLIGLLEPSRLLREPQEHGQAPSVTTQRAHYNASEYCLYREPGSGTQGFGFVRLKAGCSFQQMAM